MNGDIVGYFSPPWFGFVWNMLTHQFLETKRGNHRDIIGDMVIHISATIWYLGLSENWVLFSQHCNLNDENDHQTNPFGKWFDRKQKEWDHNYMTLRVLFLSSLNLSYRIYRLMKRVNWVNWCDEKSFPPSSKEMAIKPVARSSNCSVNMLRSTHSLQTLAYTAIPDKLWQPRRRFKGISWIKCH